MRGWSSHRSALVAAVALLSSCEPAAKATPIAAYGPRFCHETWPDEVPVTGQARRVERPRPRIRLADLEGRVTGPDVSPPRNLVQEIPLEELTADPDNGEPIARFPGGLSELVSVRALVATHGEPVIAPILTDGLSGALPPLGRAGDLPPPTSTVIERRGDQALVELPLERYLAEVDALFMTGAIPWNAMPRLRGVRLRTGPHASVERVELHRRSEFIEQAAVADLHVDRYRRRGWYAHAGARVEFTVDVPPEHPRFCTYFARPGPDSEAPMRVLVSRPGEAPTELIASAAGARWRHECVDLTPWQGGRATISLVAADTEGVSCFGEPTIEVAAARRAPDVIVFVIDMLRADALGFWRHSDDSPQIDALCEEGLVFARAYSAGNWTRSATTSLMTGRWAASHGISMGPPDAYLPETVPLLSDRFAAAGFRTGGFVGNLHVEDVGLGRRYDATPSVWHWGRSSLRLEQESEPLGPPGTEQLVDEYFEWMDARPDVATFAHFQTMEVHEHRSDIFEEEHARTGEDAYLLSIRVADAELGELLSGLRERQRDFILVLTSDHGESFREHKFNSHTNSMYQSELHVPLVLWSTRPWYSGVSHAPASLVDIAPTLLGLFDLPALPHPDGIDLIALARADTWPERSLQASMLRDSGPDLQAVVDREHVKVMRHDDWGNPRVFALTDDPCETFGADSAAEAIRRFGDVREQAEADHAEFEERFPAPQRTDVSRQTREALEALGYVAH